MGVPIINVKLDACRKRIEAMLGEDLPAGTSPGRNGRVSPAEAREAFAEIRAEAEARREAEEQRQKEQRPEQTPIPTGKVVPAEKTETAKRKEKESRGQGNLFG